MDQNYYIGFDLSTQQIKGLVVRFDLKLIHEAIVDFDAEYSQKYGVTKGVIANPSNGEIFMPTDMWLEAIDLLLERLKADGLDFSRVMCLSGAGMQHGIVNWNYDAETMLQNLSPEKTLVQQLSKAFARPYSPNWQDASTQSQCDEFNVALGSEESLAEVTGSKAHHRFSGPQVLRCRQVYPDVYKNTARISLVSSFLACIFSGDFAPIDISDVCGADLRDIKKGKWDSKLMELTAGGKEAVEDLKQKLGSIPEDGGTIHSKIHPYFVKRYGFNPECGVCVSTGDNPATILSLPLRPSDAIVSLGTSTTFLMSTPSYLPDPSYHFMNHPTTPGLYMFMLCYKNGSAAREQIRDVLNQESSKPSDIWEKYNKTVTATPPLNQTNPEEDTMKLGLYFPRSEIVPLVSPGTYRFTYRPSTGTLAETTESWNLPVADARAVIESQLLSCRLRSQRLVTPQKHPKTGASLPPQPRRIYLVGGGSVNPAIQQLVGEVLGGVEGVYRLDIGGNACGLGAAYKAVWAAERDKERGETFEELVGSRWNEEEFVKRVDVGYREGVWERYGEAVKGFDAMEKAVLQNTK